MLIPFVIGQAFQSGRPGILMVVITTMLLAALAVLGLMIGISRRVPRPRADMRLL